MGTPHDIWFHFTHRHARHAAAWLRSCLPAALVAAIDWSTLRLCSERVHGLALRLGVTDLVYELRLRGTNQRVFVLVEHRSFRDARLHDKLLRYSVQLAHGARRQRSSPPTPVITVVLYHGPGALVLRPGRSRALGQLDPTAAALLDSMQPRLHCTSDRLHSQTEAQLIARGLTPLGTLSHLSLRGLPHYSPTETLAALDRWGPILRAVDTDEGPPIGREAIATFGWYVLHVTKAPAEDVHMALEKNLLRTETTIMSTAEKLRREGLAQGRTEGLAEGLAEGRNEGRNEGRDEGLTQGRIVTLLRLLNRFGPLPPEIETRLRSGTSADLDRWTDRILDSKTLDAVFAEN